MEPWFVAYITWNKTMTEHSCNEEIAFPSLERAHRYCQLWMRGQGTLNIEHYHVCLEWA